MLIMVQNIHSLDNTPAKILVRTSFFEFTVLEDVLLGYGLKRQTNFIVKMINLNFYILFIYISISK